MCGRYALFAPPDEFAERFSVPVPEVKPTYNAAPSQRLPIIPDDAKEIQLARWGLTPEWADKERDLINARAETMDEKPSFRDARRCLIPANGFYEWLSGDEFSLAPAEELRAYPVSTAVNSPGNDSPELVREAADV